MKGAKRIHFGSPAAEIESTPTGNPRLLWKRLQALAGKALRERSVYPVVNPVTMARATTAQEISDAHRDNLAGLGAAKVINGKADESYPGE